MKRITLFVFLIAIATVACVMNKPAMSQYINYDFKNSFRKYMVKDGYVKYFVVDTLKDTSWIDVYFDDFGAREYIHFKSKSVDAEWYKSDSIQYAKSWSGYFESPERREEDVTTEKVVINPTSRFTNGAYWHKPMAKKFTANKKYKNLVGGYCWTYLNADSGRVDCNVLYYCGLPIDIRIYHRENYKYRLVRAETIDTMAAFPVVLKVRE